SWFRHRQTSNSPSVGRPGRVEKKHAWIGVIGELRLARTVGRGLPDIRRAGGVGTINQSPTVRRPLKILRLQKVIWQLSKTTKRDPTGRDRSGVSARVMYHPEIAGTIGVAQEGYLFAIGRPTWSIAVRSQLRCSRIARQRFRQQRTIEQ